MRNFIILFFVVKFCSSYIIIPIIKHDQEVRFDGKYFYNYETANGITQKEVGDEKQVKGYYSYTSPEGELIEMSYIADENGFQPFGSHVPKSVRRALEYIKTHPPYYKVDPYNNVK